MKSILVGLRDRLTYANVGVTLAVVLAGTGFAVAAVSGSTNTITGCYQKKTGALRIVTGGHKCHRNEKRLIWNQRGVPGLRGIAGTAGTPGGQGVAGATGATGPAGPFPTTLPSGKTLTGTYALLGDAMGSADDRTWTAISFQFPLASAPGAVLVPQGGTNPDPTHCSGGPTNPTAARGFLCVYEGQATNTSGTSVCEVAENGLCAPSSGAADRWGAAVETFATTDGIYLTAGTWAVTAP